MGALGGVMAYLPFKNSTKQQEQEHGTGTYALVQMRPDHWRWWRAGKGHGRGTDRYGEVGDHCRPN